MQRQMEARIQRGVRLAVGAGLAIWLGRSALFPARLRDVQVLQLSGDQPAYALIGWRFGGGMRPVSVIFDLALANGTIGSITTDGEASEAEIALIGPAGPGPYTLSVHATYRILGVIYTRSEQCRGAAPIG